MNELLKYTLKEYAILTTLILQNGALYIRGSKVKFNNAYATIQKLKNDGVISFEKIDFMMDYTKWEKLFAIYLRNFSYRQFKTIDIAKDKVFLLLI